jgi:hypothetical protein
MVRFSGITINQASIRETYRQAGKAEEGEQFATELPKSLSGYQAYIDELDKHRIDVTISGFGPEDAAKKYFLPPPKEGYLFFINPPALKIDVTQKGKPLSDCFLTTKDTPPKDVLAWAIEQAVDFSDLAAEKRGDRNPSSLWNSICRISESRRNK